MMKSKLGTLEAIRQKFVPVDWKAELRALKLAHIKKTSPGFYEASGGDTMKIPGYTDKTSNGLTKCICDWIKFHGGDAQRVNTTGMMRKINGQMKWTHSGSRRGSADIHAIVAGRAVSIEIKIGRDQLSGQQLSEKLRIEAAGGLYFVARNMDEFTRWYEKTFF
jgi:hypothetical protein